MPTHCLYKGVTQRCCPGKKCGLKKNLAGSGKRKKVAMMRLYWAIIKKEVTAEKMIL